jgi:hypothetical protein
MAFRWLETVSLLLLLLLLLLHDVSAAEAAAAHGLDVAGCLESGF